MHDANIPRVKARITTWKGKPYRAVMIEPCPYCKQKHRHSPEPGHRVAHCSDRFVGGEWIKHAPNDLGYVLVIDGNEVPPED